MNSMQPPDVDNAAIGALGIGDDVVLRQSPLLVIRIDAKFRCLGLGWIVWVDYAVIGINEGEFGAGLCR